MCLMCLKPSKRLAFMHIRHHGTWSHETSKNNSARSIAMPPTPSKATQSQTKNTKQRLVINGGGAGAAVAAATIAASQIRAGLVVAMFC